MSPGIWYWGSGAMSIVSGSSKEFRDIIVQTGAYLVVIMVKKNTSKTSQLILIILQQMGSGHDTFSRVIIWVTIDQYWQKPF